jgi:hypothetical protein
MKAVLLILALVASVSAQDGAPKTLRHNERIEDRYDKFQDSTGVILYRMKPGVGALGDLPVPFARNQIDISLIGQYPGRAKPTRFDGPVLLVLRFEPNWPEYTLPDLILLIDGQRTVLTAKRGTTSASTDRRYEARIELSPKTFTALCKATKAEGQFGAIEFHFDKDNLQAIQDFASRLNLSSP